MLWLEHVVKVKHFHGIEVAELFVVAKGGFADLNWELLVVFLETARAVTTAATAATSAAATAAALAGLTMIWRDIVKWISCSPGSRRVRGAIVDTAAVISAATAAICLTVGCSSHVFGSGLDIISSTPHRGGHRAVVGDSWMDFGLVHRGFSKLF